MQQKHNSKMIKKIKNSKSLFFMLVIIGITFLFLTNDFGLVNVESTAIILAMGVDKNDNEYELSSQIASANNESDSPDVVVVSQGVTLAEAMADLISKIGWRPKTSFCDVVVLGKSVLEDNPFECLDFFFDAEQINNSAYLIGTTGSAKEILQAQTALDTPSSISLEKVISQNVKLLNSVAAVSIKDFAKNYYNKTNSTNYLPLVEAIKADDASGGAINNTEKEKEEKPQKKDEGKDSKKDEKKKNKSEDSGGEGNGETGGSEGGAAKQGGEQKKTYLVNKTLLFDNEKATGTLNSRETRAYCLLTQNKAHSFYSTEKYNDDKIVNSNQIIVDILSKKASTSTTVENNKITYTIDLKLKVKISDKKNEKKSEKQLSDLNAHLDDEHKKMLIESMKKDFESLFNETKKANADIFFIGNKVFKFKNKKWKEFISKQEDASNYLKNVDYKINIIIK